VAASRVCCHSWLEGGFVMCVCAQLQLRPAQLQLCMPSCQLRAVGHAHMHTMVGCESVNRVRDVPVACT
jgi:hypothetical protein